MPSLSKFSFWSFVLGVVLFVLSSTPLKVISVQEGQEGTYLMLSVLLLLVGALGYITSQEIDHLERSTSEQFDSVWRNFDGVSSDVQKDMDNLSRRIDSFEE
jgi:predicted membrane channel-forming protein YqfA (hemolysin III family)